MERRLTKEWEVSAFDRVNNEWTTTMNHAYELQADVKDLLVTQAPPVRITPSRARREARDHIVYASIPDEQIGYRNIDGELEPIHDEAAMNAARMMLKEIKPDVIVAQGDTLDMAELSKFAPDSDHFIRTLQPSIDRAGRWDAELAADHPEATKVRLEGNHNRLTKFILKNAMSIHGIRRANTTTPVLTLAHLLRAEETGWNYISGYPAAEYRATDKLVFVHGDRVRSSGSTAELMSKAYPERNVVFGHVHRHELHTRTNHLGEQLMAVTFGTLARIDGFVPSHGNGVNDHGWPVQRYENWQNGIGTITQYGDVYVAEHMPIVNGVGYYRGGVFDGNR